MIFNDKSSPKTSELRNWHFQLRVNYKAIFKLDKLDLSADKIKKYSLLFGFPIIH